MSGHVRVTILAWAGTLTTVAGAVLIALPDDNIIVGLLLACLGAILYRRAQGMRKLTSTGKPAADDRFERKT